jgi:serine/threonine-protein kinase RsbT
MYGSDSLHRPQPTEQSRRWTNGSTWPIVRVPIKSDRDIVIARQQGKTLAMAMEFSSTDSAFIATTVSELARALLSRAGCGEIWLHRVSEEARAGLAIVAQDAVMQDGWCHSRAIASDLTLPEVSRLVDEFHVVSDVGRGTTIRATKWCRRSSRSTGG